MKFSFLSIPLWLTVGAALAQTPNPQDIAAIKGQCGCHEVDFKYVETFSPDKQYQFKDRYVAKGTEWVFVDEEATAPGKPPKIVIQHLLVANDTMIIKHWREDWEYQNTSLLTFDQNAAWKRQPLSPQQAKGQWTQKVFEVDDSPRYEGSATWVHADGRHYWESTVDAPLPRREYTKRHDYNVMRRTNHHEITPSGYVHEQDNDKIMRSEAGDQLLAQEKGLNVYTRTDEKKCQAAKDWWIKNRAYWVDVRTMWDEVLIKRNAVALKGQVKGNVLMHELNELAGPSLADTYNSTAVRPKIRAVMEKYLKQ